MNYKKSSLLLALLLSATTFVAQPSFALPTDPTAAPTDPVTIPVDPTTPEDTYTAPIELNHSNDDTVNPIPTKVSLANNQLINVTLPSLAGGSWCYTSSADNIMSLSLDPDSMIKSLDPVTGKIMLSHSFLISFIPFDQGKVTLTFYYIAPDHQLSSVQYSFTLNIVE